MLGFSSARAPSKRFNETPEVTIGIRHSSTNANQVASRPFDAKRDNLLSSMQDNLQSAEIVEEDISPLYLLIRGVGQVPVLYVNMSNCEIVQAIVCAGVDACISPLGMLGFSSARALSKQFNETPEVTIGIKRSSSYMQIRWPADPLMPSEMVL